MKIHKSIVFALLCIVAVDGRTDTGISGCPEAEGPALQVLGSGGPIADDGRASSGYLVWVDGRSRFLVDAGGGVFLRFGEAGARFEDLEHISISHFHTDHSTDLVALLKSGYFS
ncbi:MAG: MBL fold metallo-hydrolase, partial [Deltaproteobacteria bacterium]